MKLQTNTHGNQRQKDFFRAWANPEFKRVGYFGSKGSAKSFSIVSVIFGDAFIYPNTRYFIARKNLNDLRMYTTPTVYEVLEIWGISESDVGPNGQPMYKYNGKDDFWVLYNGSIVNYVGIQYEPSDPLYKRFGSQQYTRGAIEEAGETEKEAASSMFATIGRWKNDLYNLPGKIAYAGNPAKNWIYELYIGNKEGTLDPEICFIQTGPYDNNKQQEGYIDGLRKVLSFSEQERLINNNWDYDDDPRTLCETDAIYDLFRNEHVKGTNRKFISADLAMKGRDRFIAGPWNGLVLNLKEGVDKPFTTGKDIEGDLRKLMIKQSVPRSQTVADSDGMGQYLESYLEGIKEYHGGSKAINNVEFANLKAECGYKLSEVINNREMWIICHDHQKERIIRELGVLMADSVDADETRKRIIRKKEMRKMLGFSPDYLDMLLMRMMFELKNKGFRLKGWV